jgi:hypothetical protein
MSLFLKSSAPFTVRSINLGTSTPALSASVDLSQFPELTSFNGGTNSLSSITGFSSLTNLQELTLGTVLSTVAFHYNTLPANLKRFSVSTTAAQPQCQIRGDYKDWPRNLEYWNGASQNRLLSGDIADLPRTLTWYGGARWASVQGHLSALPPNIVNYGVSTNLLNNVTPPAIRGRFSDLPPSLTSINFFESSTLGCEWVWSEIRPSLSGIYFTFNTTISGNITDASHLRSIQFGTNVLFSPNPSIKTYDLPKGLRTLVCSSFIEGDLSELSPSPDLGWIDLRCPVSGTLVSIPSGVTSLTLLGATFNGFNAWGANTVSGDINLLNTPNLTTLYLGGLNTITGDLSGIPRSVTRYEHTNTQNTVTGNVSSLPPNLTYYDKRGNGLITGDVAGIPREVTYFNQPSTNSTLTGDISGLPPSIQTFIATAGTNTFNGDLSGLPRTLTDFRVGGSSSMTITGNISSLPPNLTTYTVQGVNNLSPIVVDVSTIPSSITSFTQQGNAYTMVGSLTGLPSSVRTFSLAGNRRATINYYDGFTEGFGKKQWPNNINTLSLAVSSGTFPASHLATLLVDLTASEWTSSPRALTLSDLSMPTISMSAYPEAKDAIDFLRLSRTSGGRGVTVTVLTAA